MMTMGLAPMSSSERGRVWHERNKERAASYARAYYERNKERAAFRNHEKHAARRGIAFELTFD